MKGEVRKGIEFLKINDSVMSKIIEKVGEIELVPHSNLYESLVRIIISQQLSNSASNTIINRFKLLIKVFSPNEVIKLNSNEIYRCGISKSKYNYILGLTELILTGDLNLEELKSLDIDQIREKLIKIKGVGEWSVSIFLIFGLGKLNVLPLKDVGIQNSIKRYYNFSKTPSDLEIITLSKCWGEFKSISCLYLWRSYDLKVSLE